EWAGWDCMGGARAAGHPVSGRSGRTTGSYGSVERDAWMGSAETPRAPPRAFESVACVADDLGSAAVASPCPSGDVRGVRGRSAGATGGPSPAGGLAVLGARPRGAGPGQSADDASQSASRHSCGTALLQPRFALPRPHPGRQYRADACTRQVRAAAWAETG